MEFFPLEMKKCLPLLLALQILLMSSLSNQGLKSFFKMGSFFHHFAHHIICNQENINIIEFVQLHYSDHEHNKGDHPDHENLPFKDNDHDDFILKFLQGGIMNIMIGLMTGDENHSVEDIAVRIDFIYKMLSERTEI